MCPAESTCGLIKTNLLVFGATAIAQTKSWANPSWDDRVSSVTQTDGQRDGFSALYSRWYMLWTSCTCIWDRVKSGSVSLTHMTHWSWIWPVYIVTRIWHRFLKKQVDICDWASKNGPSGHINFDYIFQICCIITYDLIIQLHWNLYIRCIIWYATF